ncbi:MAG: hypothetical protein AAFQ73_03955 [Pseudomonadota bacterium]
MKLLVSAALAIGVSGCAIATPFEFAEDAPAPTSSSRVVVVITEAQLGDDSVQRRIFWRHVTHVEASLKSNARFLGFAKRLELFGDRAWTMTAWADTESLDAFVRSDAHQTAIAEAYGGLKGARFARVEMARSELPPDWSRMLELLDETGRSY